MTADRGIVVAYAGVHQAYQIALAAQELGRLDAFYCALYDGEGMWGRSLGRFVGNGLMEGRSAAGLDPERVHEFPWPLVAKVARDRLYPRGRGHWLAANALFDLWAARRIRRIRPALFVGTSTSDLHSLRAARKAGARLLHDVHHLHPTRLAELLQEAHERAGIPLRRARRPRFLRTMDDRKLDEMAVADRLLTYSEFHRSTYVAAGFDAKSIAVTPLWVDADLWKPAERAIRSTGERLRVLFVGAVILRKGIPFLLEAARLCGSAIELTIAGPQSLESARLLERTGENVRVLPAIPNALLGEVYREHDLLVLPSVGDPFGFVGLEAMACGLPVVVTDNCGVPLPDPSWSVPAMDSEALAQRIFHYVDEPERLAIDGAIARDHAAAFTPQRFRDSVKSELRALLG